MKYLLLALLLSILPLNLGAETWKSKKPVFCSTNINQKHEVLVDEENRKLFAAWIDVTDKGSNIMMYVNPDNGTVTIIQNIGNIFCVLPSGNGLVVKTDVLKDF